jgi:predicted RNase H-like nuclease (RuvC/YqgF family)
MKLANGKIDRKIVKALFKVCIDDIEYEISARTDYIEYQKSEIKRLKEALNYYNKMQATSLPRKKEYYERGAKSCLRRNEKVELIPEIYKQLNQSLKDRKTHIEKLYSEARQIKHLVV